MSGHLTIRRSACCRRVELNMVLNNSEPMRDAIGKHATALIQNLIERPRRAGFIRGGICRKDDESHCPGHEQHEPVHALLSLVVTVGAITTGLIPLQSNGPGQPEKHNSRTYGSNCLQQGGQDIFHGFSVPFSEAICNWGNDLLSSTL